MNRAQLAPWLQRVATSAAARRGILIGRAEDDLLLKRNFNLPLPDLDTLDDVDVWSRLRPMPGITLDLPAQVAWGLEALAPHVPELDGPSDGLDAFDVINTTYSVGDAHLTYAIVRHTRPKRIVELGSGQSTLVLARALRANARNESPGRLRTFDPFPSEVVPAWLAGLESIAAVPAQEIDPAEFAELEAGDILFVDTTHTVQIGGDVDHIILRVLPILAPGVLVHFHDIWLPHEYHPALFRHLGVVWAEQYLLEAFLAYNPTYEVVLATQAIAQAHADALRSLVPTYDGSTYPTSFWLRRTDAA